MAAIMVISILSDFIAELTGKKALQHPDQRTSQNKTRKKTALIDP
jgi:hypothetical protein